MTDTAAKKDAAEAGKETQAIPDTAFDALEKDFQEVLQELMGDRSLEKFRLEYEKLHKALKKSHESEKRLMQKCRELNAEIVANSAKVATALKLSQEDQSTIASLKKEIEKAWKMVDAAHEKETRSRDTIQSLKQEISNLTKLVEQGSGLTQGQENSVNELLKVKEELSRERDDLLADVVKLREQVAEAQVKQTQQDQQQQEMLSKIQELKQDILVKDNEAQRESRKRDKLERDLRQAKSDLDAKSGEAVQLQASIERLKLDIARTEQLLKEKKVAHERTSKDMEVLQQRQQKAQSDLEQQMINVAQLNSDNQNKASELKQKEDEVNLLKQEITKLNKLQEGVQRKLQAANQQRSDVEKERDGIKNQISSLDKDLEAKKKQAEMDKKAIDDLTRERDILNKSLTKAAGSTQKQVNLVKLHEQSKKNLEQEITNYKEEAQKQRKIIYQLEKERDKYINEASELTQKVLQHMEDIKVREMQIFDFKKKIAESETKLKQQQNLYEAVRSDRNLYSKNLIESQDEITEMKRKLKIMNHQIDQLKDEISTKEAALVKERLEHDRVDKEKEALKAELQEMRQQADKDQAKINSQEQEAEKLQKQIKEADTEKLRQKKELDQVISQRDILGAQLVGRNSELALLYEKIKIQQSTLNKGETQYNQRLEDIRLLKLEIRKIRREKAILLKTVANVDDLRREVYHLQRELLRERTRCRALEEELENPMNIHRWRKLEGSDPSTYEMIQKIHMLQKRLISKTEEVVEKELLIQEKEKLYIELKHILARQPGPEVAEQLSLYQQTLREKTKQLKAMSSELNMYESQVSEYKYEQERIARELQEVKKKYFMQKKKEQHTKEKEKAIQQAGQPPILPQRTDQSRFTGGGFNLRQPAGKVIS